MADLDQIEDLEAKVEKQQQRIEMLETEVRRLSDELRRVPAIIADQIRRRG